MNFEENVPKQCTRQFELLPFDWMVPPLKKTTPHLNSSVGVNVMLQRRVGTRWCKTSLKLSIVFVCVWNASGRAHRATQYVLESWKENTFAPFVLLFYHCTALHISLWNLRPAPWTWTQAKNTIFPTRFHTQKDFLFLPHVQTHNQKPKKKLK